MKKHGFTLAEILITLGIIGVVAALTAPALVQNAGQAKIGPSLAKFVNTFEIAVENMMNEESESSLYPNGYSIGYTTLKQIAKHMVMVPINKNLTPYYIYTADGTKEAYKIVHSTSSTWQLKNGTLLTVEPLLDDAYTGKASYTGSNILLLVDIGGINGKHRCGKEVFGFALDRNGKLVPYGSNAYNYLTGNDVTCNAASANVKQNLACTGKIADNNWKADY